MNDYKECSVCGNEKEKSDGRLMVIGKKRKWVCLGCEKSNSRAELVRVAQ